MRSTPLHEFFAAAGARFTERHGAETVVSTAQPEQEYARVRDTVALSDASFMQVFRLPEAGAMDALDPLLAGNVARTRFGRLLHTFLADENGHLEADCYVANNDDEFLLMCESIVDDAVLRARIMEGAGAASGIEDLTDSHALLSLDGYQAWAVAREIFGADILGLPYLSVETCSFEGEKVRLFRAGKTSEFGYLASIQRDKAPALAAAMAAASERLGGGLVGTAIHNDLRLEGRFFNIHAEGNAIRDPLPLGLQWMIDFEKEEFQGAAAIQKRRQDGLKQKIIGVRADPGQELLPDMPLFDDGVEVGRLVTTCMSHVLGCRMGLALLDVAIAYSGLTLQLGAAGGPSVATVSMPPIMPKSLTVKLDEV